MFRDLQPLSRDVLKASQLVSQRSTELTALMGNLSKIATTLGNNETQLTSFVRGNAGVFHAFAVQDSNIQQAIKAAAVDAPDDEHGADPRHHARGHRAPRAHRADADRTRARADAV